MRPYQVVTKRGTMWIHEHFTTTEEAENAGYHFLFEDEKNGPIYSMQIDDDGLYFHYAKITDMHRYKVPFRWEMRGYVYVDARSAEESIEVAKKEGVYCTLPLDDSRYVEDTLELDEDSAPVDITEDETHQYLVNSIAINGRTKVTSSSYVNAVSVEDAYMRAHELLPENERITSVRRVTDEL